MKVSTIEMPAELARKKYDEYRDALRGRTPTNEDRGTMLGYKALTKGRMLLDLNEVFRNCPADEKGRPKLALARAHWVHVRLNRSSGGSACFYQGRNYRYIHGRWAWHQRIMLPPILPVACRPPGKHLEDLVAMVPTIPPNLRPTQALNRYTILFEPEWERVPPTDPMLLRHLHGSLYAVFAVWDLTPLEKAVLSGRLMAHPAM